MEIKLTSEEVATLKRILGSYLSDLRMEIVDTEDHDLREELKQDERTINVVLARIEEMSKVAS